MEPALPQTPPARREDVVDSCTKQAEDKDGKRKKEQAT
jgi:hypothetical protein